MKLERVVKRFYDELENGKIMGKKCPGCSAVQFPPRIACTACGNFETDWIELSGRGMVTFVIMPSKMTDPRCDVFKPFGLGLVKLEEGPEVNMIVRGIPEGAGEEFKARLPLPVKAIIFQRDGFKTVVFDLVK